MSRPVIAITYSSIELATFYHWRQMFEGIVHVGAVPLAIDVASENPHVEELVARADGLILSGGVDVDPVLYGGAASDPLVTHTNLARDRNEIRAIETATSARKPILAICRGAQLWNAAAGGTLFADLPRDFPRSSAVGHRRTEESLVEVAHSVDVSPGSQLAGLLGTSGAIHVNSQHHQGISRLADGLVASARSSDGLVEGFESTISRMVAVQWHPEVLWDVERHAYDLLSNFAQWSAVEAAHQELVPAPDPLTA